MFNVCIVFGNNVTICSLSGREFVTRLMSGVLHDLLCYLYVYLSLFSYGEYRFLFTLTISGTQLGTWCSVYSFHCVRSNECDTVL
jgi:hypothetical protein